MRGCLKNKLKQNNAFTMIEMLIVVAITVILLGVSMLALSEFVTTLKMTELDNYAKTIYLEAQNQLIAEKVEGGMPAMTAKYETNRSENRLEKVPQDYTYDVADDEWRNLFYVSKSDAYSDDLISTQSFIYNENGDYIIEFNPQTGMIYGVFYWDKDTAINYEEDIVGLVDRTREERTASHIGYYGGMDSEEASSVLVLDQQVELVNDEELYLKISYNASARLLTYYNSSLTIDYSITDEHGNEWAATIDSSNMLNQKDHIDVVPNGRRLDVCILLDSMAEGYGFADIVAGSGLVLDDELTFKVTSIYDHGSDYCMETNDASPVLGNGLFANGTDKIVAEGGVQSVTVQIEKARHLRNLDMLNPVSNVEIVMTDHVDFDSDDYAWTITRADGQVTKISCEGTGEGVRPIDTFAPIKNADVFENAACTVVIDGRNNKLQNFDVVSNTDNTGIFSQVNDVNFSNIVIEDITVNGSNNVGALVGTMSGGSMTNCGVHLSTEYTESGITTVYSQTDAEEGDYANEMERRVNTFVVSGINNVGGLAGVLDDVEVNGSYAAIKVKASGSYAGGFVGTARNSTSIICSYSSGDVTGDVYVNVIKLRY